MSLRRRRFLVSLFFLAVLVAGWQPVTTYRQWSDWKFAPNGVCVSPSCFVVYVEPDETNAAIPVIAQSFTLRNVPGEGDCMFQAVALASFASVGLGGNDVLLRAITRELRSLTASVLEQPSEDNDEKYLVVTGSRLVSASRLLASAAHQEGLSRDDYLAALRREGIDGGLYGGGPELTVLCNILRRPITIYEVAETNNNSSQTNGETTDDTESICRIVPKGTFGGARFADPLAAVPHAAVHALSSSILPGAYSWHLHILVVETPEKHACVLLPQQPTRPTTDR